MKDFVYFNESTIVDEPLMKKLSKKSKLSNKNFEGSYHETYYG